MTQPSSDANRVDAASPVSVFISYAREDNRVRQDLAESLLRDGLEVTGDWTLVHGPDYWDQLVQLVRQSDVLLALLSPAFAASDVARREVEEAASLGKRILPVVIEDVPDPDLLHPSLRQPQWAFLRPHDPVDVNRGVLVQAVRTDFGDLKLHTDLLLAAVRWQASGKDRGLTLRGSSLKSASAWVTRTQARPADWFPKPTNLQQEYVRASVGAARQRRTVAAVAVAALLIVAAVAGSRIRAEQAAARRAEEQREALAAQEASRREAAQALALLPFARDEAAAHVQNALAAGRTPQAVDADRQVSLLRGALDVRFDISGVSRLGFLGDDAIVALGTDENPRSERDLARVFIRCVADSDIDRRYRAAFSLRTPDNVQLRSLVTSEKANAILAAGGNRLYAYSFSPPRRRDCDGINIIEWTPPPRVLTHTAEITAVAVNISGTLMAFGDDQGTVVVARLPSLDVVNTIRHKYEYPVYTQDASGKETSVAAPGTKGAVTALAFDHDDRRIAVGTAVGVIAIWPTVETVTRPAWQIASTKAVHALAMHPQLDVIAIASDDGIFIAAASPAVGPVQQNLGVHTGPVRSVVFSADGRYLMSGSDDQLVLVWDMVGIENPYLVSEHPRDDDRLLMNLRGHTRSVTTMALATSGELFASGGEDGVIVLRSLDPLDAIQADARKALAEQRGKEEEARAKEPVPPPPTAEEIGVMIAIPGLDAQQAERAGDILSRHSVESVSGVRADAGTTYTNTDWMPRDKAESIVRELAAIGVSAEIRTP